MVAKMNTKLTGNILYKAISQLPYQRKYTVIILDDDLNWVKLMLYAERQVLTSEYDEEIAESLSTELSSSELDRKKGFGVHGTLKKALKDHSGMFLWRVQVFRQGQLVLAPANIISWDHQRKLGELLNSLGDGILQLESRHYEKEVDLALGSSVPKVSYSIKKMHKKRSDPAGYGLIKGGFISFWHQKSSNLELSSIVPH
ncbi:hypothetical protein QAD02_005181 [Eretmocerus hayati]|uniref:Uncharacterized protein n=1 Tax=Eretmocerus hayati TaxID=131215 RepID=A0ACC2NS40_9HYME|nr:hypothetical protein QAD02_005181 [Eretmocerus hayati]